MLTGQLNHDFQTCVNHLVTHGMTTKPRDQETKELLNYHLVIHNPRNRVITSTARKISPQYLLGELVWYLVGKNTIDDILPFSKFWANITNSGKPDSMSDHYPAGTVNSNYGNRIFGHATIPGFVFDQRSKTNQWSTVKRILQADPDSRQAIINIHVPSDRHEGNKDVPCTLSLQFFIRENALHMIVNMRSNDIIRGFCNDVFQFSMLQEILLLELRKFYPTLELGQYFHNTGSMHLYEMHYPMADGIQNEEVCDFNMIEMDDFNSDILEGLVKITKAFSDLKTSGGDLPSTFEGYDGFDQLTFYWKACVDYFYLKNANALFHLTDHTCVSGPHESSC